MVGGKGEDGRADSFMTATFIVEKTWDQFKLPSHVISREFL